MAQITERLREEGEAEPVPAPVKAAS